MIKFIHFLCFFIPFTGFAQLPQTPFAPKHYICYRTTAPLQIDGILNEISWQNAGQLSVLEAETIEFNGQVYTPSLEVTSSLYEIYCTDPSSTNTIWHINQEGKVWKTQIP